MAFGGGQFVGVGGYTPAGWPQPRDHAVMAISPDGINWAQTADLESGVLTSAAYGSGYFVATGAYGTYSSADGVQWVRRDTHPATGVVFGKRRFVALGGPGSVPGTNSVTRSGAFVQLQIRLGPGGPSVVILNGDVGQTYILEASSNFRDWTTLTAVTITSEGSVELKDGFIQFSGYRFYRVRDNMQ
jgi:hypothetical protein